MRMTTRMSRRAMDKNSAFNAMRRTPRAIIMASACGRHHYPRHSYAPRTSARGHLLLTTLLFSARQRVLRGAFEELSSSWVRACKLRGSNKKYDFNYVFGICAIIYIKKNIIFRCLANLKISSSSGFYCSHDLGSATCLTSFTWTLVFTRSD